MKNGWDMKRFQLSYQHLDMAIFTVYMLFIIDSKSITETLIIDTTRINISENIYSKFLRLGTWMLYHENKVREYDLLVQMLINSPRIQLTNLNKDIKLTEKVIGRQYYWGQFNKDHMLHGYGFLIWAGGSLFQGKFVEGELNKKHSFVSAITDYRKYVYQDVNSNYLFVRHGFKSINEGYIWSHYCYTITQHAITFLQPSSFANRILI